ncbi:hypothetical protein ABLE91_05610 [Aquabacter sp. CN5-332]|uniref:hypothetical protein n=1 Tax=Aquabacter sp. CN5-332 TaxID=3156608 RepID=UPI0032B39315
MAKKTFFVVQPYELNKRGKLKASPAMEVRSADDARRVAERMSVAKAGAVAFSADVDTDFGDADPPVFIASFGQVPDEAAEMG